MLSTKNVLLLLLVAVACSHHQNAGPASAAVANVTSLPPSNLTVKVITASDNATRLPGADVFVIRGTGSVERLGTTDEFGLLVIKRDALTNGGIPPVGIMFCHPAFFCGILRADDVAHREDPTIALAPYVTD
jgi:hypothetical protein